MTFCISSNANNLDFEAFSRLNEACFPHEPISTHDFQAFIKASFWTVTRQGEPVGYAVMSHHGNRAHIRRIGIHPAYRRQGLGHQLMQSILDQAAGLGAAWIDLSVQQDNPAAIHLYRKYGFQFTGESVQFSLSIPSPPATNYAAIPVNEFRGHAEAIQAWSDSHAPPNYWVLVFMQGNVTLGFTRFSPDFPGCSPFEIFEDTPLVDIQALVSTLGPYTLPGKTTVKITTGNPTAIGLFKTGGIRQNYSLYGMGKTLP